MHPETGHGGDRKSDQVDNLSTRSFAAETAIARVRMNDVSGAPSSAAKR